MRFGILLITVLLCGAVAEAQELEPRAYSSSPVGTSFLVGGFSRSEGGILFDSSVDIDDAQANLWIATTGVGHVFGIAGRQAKVLAVFPIAWGNISGTVLGQPQSRDVSGLVDPRVKVSVALAGAPVMTLAEFAKARPRTAIGAGVTLLPPWGQYDSERLVNIGANRWGFKPEMGISHPAGRWTLEASAGVWFFTTNDSYYPGNAVREQEPIVAVQTHVGYDLPRRSWVAVNATWFSGGETRTNGVPNNDLQRNTRIGATLSLPIARRQSVKIVYSTGAATRRGSDFHTLTATWQLVMF